MNRGSRSYRVTVRNRSGVEETIDINASCLDELYRKLASQNRVAIDVKENLLNRFILTGWRHKLSRKEIHALFDQLSTYLDAGVPLEKAFEIFSKEASFSARFQQFISDVHKGLRSGKKLSDMLAENPDIFQKHIAATIRAGEESGKLVESLTAVASLIKREIKLRESVISALTYPLILLSTACLSVLLIIYFAVPRFARMFLDMGKEMPVIMKAMFYVSNHFWLSTGSALLIVASATALGMQLLRQAEFREKLEKLLIKTPGIGRLLLSYQYAIYFRILGMALQSSLPIDKGLELSLSSLITDSLKKKFNEVLLDVRKGKSMSASLSGDDLVPSSVVNLLRVAEESGRLDEMSIKIADILGDEVNRDLKKFVSLAEPLIILFVSIIIGGIIISLLYSLFSINF